MPTDPYTAATPYLANAGRPQRRGRPLRVLPYPMPQQQPAAQQIAVAPQPTTQTQVATSAAPGQVGAQTFGTPMVPDLPPDPRGIGGGTTTPPTTGGTPVGIPTTPGSTTPGYVPGTGQFDPNLPFEQYPTAAYGFPLMEYLMTQAGMEKVTLPDGRTTWRQKYPGRHYDPEVVNDLMGSQRDMLEPEMLRMISGGEEALAGRGMERSSLQSGMQGGMRSQYMEAMIQARAKLVEQERQKQWEHLLQALSGTSGMTSALGGAAYDPPPEAPDDDSWWDSLMDNISGVLPFIFSTKK